MHFARTSSRHFLQVASVLAVAWFGYAGPTVAQENVSVRLNWFASGYNTPFYVGVEKGFYREVGLNVEVQEGQGGGPTVAQVAAGRSTFGFTAIDAPMKAASQGAPIKIIASMARDAGFCVLVKAGSGIKKPVDLIGKTFAAIPQSSIGRMFPAYLKAAGVSLDAVKLLSVDAANITAGFLSGQYDAKAALYFDEVPTSEARGVPVNCLLYSDVGLSMLGHVIVTNIDMINNKPRVVQNFVSATIKAYEYSFANPKEAVAIGKKYASDSLANEQAAIGQLEAFHGIASQPLGSFSAAEVKSTALLLRDTIGLDHDASEAKSFYSDQFVKVK